MQNELSLHVEAESRAIQYFNGQSCKKDKANLKLNRINNYKVNKYGLHAKFKTHQRQRDEFISILLEAAKLVSTAKGCHHYIIYKDAKHEDGVFVSEIWDSKEDHDNSLKVEGCMQLISKAMPLIDGKPETSELEVIGGKGLDL